MRRFHSYGPVNAEAHFTVKRRALIRHCLDTMIGDGQEGGHYFTIWAPRQTGKTWLMRQVKKEIAKRHQGQFAMVDFSTGVLRGVDLDAPLESDKIPAPFSSLLNEKIPSHPNITTWNQFRRMFSRENGLWKKPLVMFVDEIDTLPSKFLDLLVGQFRELYLDRTNNHLHGLALIGVHAVLGVESERGSPFNIQRSLHVPNFTPEEVEDLYGQYQEETGQTIKPEVVARVYEATRGQPGLVCWLGELLTEKYNPGGDAPIDMPVWQRVHRRACNVEWNNTVLNIIKKASGKYLPHVLKLFSRSDVRFNLRADWCGFLYLNGVIDYTVIIDANKQEIEICRFASPFVQTCLYNALTYQIIGDDAPILALEPLDDLADVFDSEPLGLEALLKRYKNYLKRLRAKGIDPWRDQPRRSDLHPTEAVGHFHLYAWLKQAVEDYCMITPEFPTGNGKVDLCLTCGEKRGIIEVKSYQNMSVLAKAKRQAAGYARQIGLDGAVIALFTPVQDEKILARLSVKERIDGVDVIVCAIGWG